MGSAATTSSKTITARSCSSSISTSANRESARRAACPDRCTRNAYGHSPPASLHRPRHRDADQASGSAADKFNEVAVSANLEAKTEFLFVTEVVEDKSGGWRVHIEQSIFIAPKNGIPRRRGES